MLSRLTQSFFSELIPSLVEQEMANTARENAHVTNMVPCRILDRQSPAVHNHLPKNWWTERAQIRYDWTWTMNLVLRFGPR
jgi:hypothetical protein